MVKRISPIFSARILIISGGQVILLNKKNTYFYPLDSLSKLLKFSTVLSINRILLGYPYVNTSIQKIKTPNKKEQKSFESFYLPYIKTHSRYRYLQSINDGEDTYCIFYQTTPEGRKILKQLPFFYGYDFLTVHLIKAFFDRDIGIEYFSFCLAQEFYYFCKFPLEINYIPNLQNLPQQNFQKLSVEVLNLGKQHIYSLTPGHYIEDDSRILNKIFYPDLTILTNRKRPLQKSPPKISIYLRRIKLYWVNYSLALITFAAMVYQIYHLQILKTELSELRSTDQYFTESIQGYNILQKNQNKIWRLEALEQTHKQYKNYFSPNLDAVDLLLPETMWLKSFKQNFNTINLEVISTATPPFDKLLSQLKQYNNFNDIKLISVNSFKTESKEYNLLNVTILLTKNNDE